MLEASTMIRAPEEWCEQGWRFRLYAVPSGSSEDIESPELLKIVKFHIRTRVVSIIALGETARQGFAIATALSFGKVRIQIYWWTSECDLHREAVLGQVQKRCWERLPSWEIGNPTEIAIISHETARFAQSFRN